MDGEEPALSVVLATDEMDKVRESLTHLRGQSGAERLELVLVVPAAEVTAARTTDGFHSVRVVERDPRPSLAAARVAGLGASSAPIVAFAETHCFPEPGWAEALIEAHRGPWAAVGPEMDNENPTGAISWANLLIGYGPWVAPTRRGEAEHLPGRNSCYKRSVLLDYGDELVHLLDSESIIHWDLRARGHRLYLEPSARVRHRNIVRLRPATGEQYCAGRAFATIRSRGWSPARRAAYAAGTPLLPALRLTRLLLSRRRRGRASEALRWLPATAWLLGASAVGELTGYITGGGEGMLRRLASHELSDNR